MSMTIEWSKGRTLSTEVRGQPVQIRLGSGEPGAPPGSTPTDMFLFALGGCVAVYAADYAERHDIATEGMKIEVDYEPANKPKRIGALKFAITMPGEVPEKHRKPIMRVASQCYLHNTLSHPPQMEVTLNY